MRRDHIQMDLQKDWDEILERRLAALGIQSRKYGGAMDYFRVQSRLVERRPRRIVRARGFECPAGYEEKLKRLEQAIQRGENLHPYMTRRLKMADTDDLLLSDWGIYHFHLSDVLEKDGFMRRSAYLLMARMEQDVVYFLKIYPHNESQLWSKKEMLRIVYENWPETIEKYHLNGMVSLSETLSDAQYYRLRRAHASCCVELGPNLVYGMLGGGYASDGSPIQAVREHGYYIRILRVVERILEDCLWKMLSQMEKENGQMMGEARVKLLSLDGEEFVLIEENSGLGLRVNPWTGVLKAASFEHILWRNQEEYKNYMIFRGPLMNMGVEEGRVRR